MYTFSDWKRFYQRFTGSTDNDEIVDNLNEGNRQAMSALETYTNEETFTVSTVASQDRYQFPVSYEKITSVTVTFGTIQYSPEEITNITNWKRLTVTNTETSDYPTYFYTDKNSLYLYPKPSSATGTITVVAMVNQKNLDQDDETAGTISIDNATVTVTGSGTDFSTSYVGWKILLPDGYWYTVSSVESTTSLTIIKKYEGVTATGSTYRIGQVSKLPESAQLLPVYYGAKLHFAVSDPAKSGIYDALYTGSPDRGDGIFGMQAKYRNRSTNLVSDNHSNRLRNPNDYPILS